jgi:hypothetical protein
VSLLLLLRQTGVAGDATGTVLVGTVTLTGTDVTGTAGQRATGTIAVGTVTLSGTSTTGTAGQGATGSVAIGTVTISGATVIGSEEGGIFLGTITGGDITITGTTVTADDGVTVTALVATLYIEPALTAALYIDGSEDDMTTEYIVGDTIHLGFADVTDIDGDAVTSGATVVMTIADDLTRLVESTTTITSPSDGDDWLATLTAPSVPGVYTVKVQATHGSTVLHGTQDITVLPF